MGRRPVLPRNGAWRALAGATAVATLAGVAWLVADRWPTPKAPPAARAAAQPARHGPGLWTGAGALPAAPVRADTEPPAGPMVDAGKNLVIDRGLRFLFDYFLLGGLAGERPVNAERLRARLQATLPPGAYKQAARIVQDYLTYIERHDALVERSGAQALKAARDTGLAATADARVDVEGLEQWMAVRNRLRQDILGVQVTHAFFDDEDASMRAMLERERLGRAGLAVEAAENAATPYAALVEYGRMTAANTATAERQAFFAARFGPQAADRLARLEDREREWQERYLRYRDEANGIRAQAGAAQVDKDRQLAALRAGRFPLEHERLRAEALDTEPEWPPHARH